MTTPTKLETWTTYATISRGWSLAFDTKAGFVTAINLGLLAALWSGTVLLTSPQLACYVIVLGAITTVLSVVSLITALYVILPRQTPEEIFGKHVKWSGSYGPISYYGFVAKNYSVESFAKFHEMAKRKDEDALSYEALEQHFTISHTVQRKSILLARSGYILALAFVFYGLTVLTRLFS